MSQVTVIVPVYNLSQYVDKCVDSVLKQTYRDFTLILIDDGSTDDSIDKCIGWGKTDSRVIVVSKANTGLGPTRNLGVKMSSSEYVTFLDADDWWHPNYLELMVEGTEFGKNDIVICDINFAMEISLGEYKYHRSALRFPEGALKISDEWNLINRARTFMCGKLYRKNLFTAYQVEQPAHAYEDVATTPYLVARAQSIYYSPHGLYYYYRNRSGSIVNNFSSLNGLLISLKELYERFRTSGLLVDFYASLRQLFWGQFVFICHSLKTRFPDPVTDDKEQVSRVAKEIICSCFPELEGMLSYTFGVPGNERLLVEGLKKIVVNEDAILQGGDSIHADFIVTTKKVDSYGKDILIPVPNKPVHDEERAAWDIADEIFRGVFS